MNWYKTIVAVQNISVESICKSLILLGIHTNESDNTYYVNLAPNFGCILCYINRLWPSIALNQGINQYGVAGGGPWGGTGSNIALYLP